MFALNLKFDLPAPWINSTFECNHLGHITFLVGPNASGKTRFAKVLKEHLQVALFDKLLTKFSSSRQAVPPVMDLSFFPTEAKKNMEEAFRQAVTLQTGFIKNILLAALKMPDPSGYLQQMSSAIRQFVPEGAIEELLQQRVRLLSADRLVGFFGGSGVPFFPHTIAGYDKSAFPTVKTQAFQADIGTDVFIILAERMDLRIRIEATLSQSFQRDIILDWDAGKLVPMVRDRKSGASYRADLNECHGLRELIVLLTHVYDEESSVLIVDEPELNLHPQHQRFVVQEMRRMAGDPLTPGKKLFILITHSPFILDLANVDDIRSLLCFDLNFGLPAHLLDAPDEQVEPLRRILPRLNAHHKQLFFAQKPVFVEGVTDLHFIGAILEKCGRSLEAAGSCLIDVGGAEEVALYYELCQALKKEAYFIYDLDALFRQGLRQTAGTHEKVTQFLAKIGAGDDFQRVCGDLEKDLSTQADKTRSGNTTDLAGERLKDYLINLPSAMDNSHHRKARLAILVHIACKRDSALSLFGEASVQRIEGRLRLLLGALREKGVFLLPGGILEHYLQHGEEIKYALDEDQKRKLVTEELAWIQDNAEEATFRQRYGSLYAIIESLPGIRPVDVLDAMEGHISKFIWEVQNGIATGKVKEPSDIPRIFEKELSFFGKNLRVEAIEIESSAKFTFKLIVTSLPSYGEVVLPVDEKTNPGVGRFGFHEAANKARKSV